MAGNVEGGRGTDGFEPAKEGVRNVGSNDSSPVVEEVVEVQEDCVLTARHVQHLRAVAAVQNFRSVVIEPFPELDDDDQEAGKRKRSHRFLRDGVQGSRKRSYRAVPQAVHGAQGLLRPRPEGRRRHARSAGAQDSVRSDDGVRHSRSP